MPPNAFQEKPTSGRIRDTIDQIIYREWDKYHIHAEVLLFRTTIFEIFHPVKKNCLLSQLNISDDNWQISDILIKIPLPFREWKSYD